MQFIGHLENPFHGLISWFHVGPNTGINRTGGWVPGSVCGYDEPGYVGEGFYTGGFVAVGYGESQQRWSKLRRASKNGLPNSIDEPNSICAERAPERPLRLGYGAQAFINTENLVACQDADPTLFPRLPTSYYVVTVLTRRREILQVGLYNATLAATENLLTGFVKQHGAPY